jgi:hypothetical protein
VHLSRLRIGIIVAVLVIWEPPSACGFATATSSRRSARSQGAATRCLSDPSFYFTRYMTLYEIGIAMVTRRR